VVLAHHESELEVDVCADAVVASRRESSKKRWTSQERLKVRLEAGYNFEHRVLPRWRVTANQLTNYLVVCTQIAGRKLFGVNAPELYWIRDIHREHLKRSLKP
jgi:hypothetical protein